VKHTGLTTILLLTLLCLISSASSASTWYVNGVSGSDSHNCMSSLTACKTIGHAISLAVPGDSVMVAAATYYENLTIGISLKVIGSGASTTIIDGGGVGAGVAGVGGTNVTLSRVTVRHGAASLGGGIYNAGTLTINNSTISGNRAISTSRFCCRGGGIYNAGTLTINNSTIRANRAMVHSGCLFCGLGGGVFSSGRLIINNSKIQENNAALSGGGIATNSYTANNLMINNSTISGNSATIGGGIQAGSAANNLMINSSTISGNSAAEDGGGINTDTSGSTLTISSSTISGNSATIGGGISNFGTAIILKNSIVANSSSGGNCSGTITSQGHNLSSDHTCNFTNTGDLNNTDPMLGPLQNNGGPTATMALPLGSPAVDAGNPTGCTDGLGHLLKTDQRGKPRPDAEETAGCDIGAYEYQGAQQAGHCVFVCGSTRCGMLTGYCVGSVNNACRSTFDPFQCPAGKPAGGWGSSCGATIDTTRTCTP